MAHVTFEEWLRTEAEAEVRDKVHRFNSCHSAMYRINEIHLNAFSRPATEKEIDWARRFLKSIAEEYQTDINNSNVWRDLCHLIYNRKEFIYLF